MTGAEIALAVSLLVAPIDAPLPEINAAEWPVVQSAVWTVAVNWELMDPRETNFLFNRVADAQNDIAILRKRRADLAGVPFVADAMRFPNRDVVNEGIQFNRNLRNYAEGQGRINLDRERLHQEIVSEIDECYRVWDAIRDARCDSFYVTTRRMALKKIRDKIGAQSYYAGELPPFVPFWRLREMP